MYTLAITLEAHLLRRAVRQPVAADAQVAQPLVQVGQEAAQAAVLGCGLRQVEHGLAARLLHQPRPRDVELRQGEQRRQVCRARRVRGRSSELTTS